MLGPSISHPVLLICVLSAVSLRADATFEGEAFGRVLSGELERKKLDKSIGPIDELMLRSLDDSNKLVEIYGCHHLGTASETIGGQATEAVCRDLQARYGLKFVRREKVFREGSRFVAETDGICVLVRNHSNFFQNEQVVDLTVVDGSASARAASAAPVPHADLEISEVMGVRLGDAMDSAAEPSGSLMNFDRVVRQSRDGRVIDGAYAVRDVSALTVEQATAEFDRDRAAIEAMHGIKLRKVIDYDLVKRCNFDGENVAVSLKFEYLKKKQIRYSVSANEDYLRRLRQDRVGGDSRSPCLFIALECVLGIAICWLVLRIRKRSLDESLDDTAKPMTTLGTCEICGQYAEVSRRTMTMFRGDGKIKPLELKSFEYVACAACESTLSNDRRNHVAAIVLGCLAVMGPLSSIALVDWHIKDLCSERFAGIVEFGFFIVPLFVMMFMTKVKKIHFQRVAAFHALREQKFKLCNLGLFEALVTMAFSFGICAFIAFLAVLGVRAWQDTLVEGRATILQSDVRCVRHETRRGHVSYSARAKYQYEYTVDGKAYVGSSVDAITSQYDMTGQHPWKKGAVGTIWYDRENPARSIDSKLDVLAFGKTALIGFLFLCGLCCMQRFYDNKGKKTLAENASVRV